MNMNIIINSKSDIYKNLPTEIQNKVDNIIHLKTKLYFVKEICPEIQKNRIQHLVKEIIYNYWLVFKFNLVERMYSNNRFYLNILEGDFLYFFNDKRNVYGVLSDSLRIFLEKTFTIQVTDYYDFQLKTRKYDKYLRILILLRSLSFNELEDFYFYCLFLRNDSS